MTDTYLPSFEAGVRKGHASGIMCSYNAETYGSWAQHHPNGSNKLPYDGVPSCANKGPVLRQVPAGTLSYGEKGYYTGTRVRASRYGTR